MRGADSYYFGNVVCPDVEKLVLFEPAKNLSRSNLNPSEKVVYTGTSFVLKPGTTTCPLTFKLPGPKRDGRQAHGRPK